MLENKDIKLSDKYFGQKVDDKILASMDEDLGFIKDELPDAGKVLILDCPFYSLGNKLFNVDKVTLLQNLSYATGGQGSLFLTDLTTNNLDYKDATFIAKIYNLDELKKFSENKLMEMLRYSPENRHIGWPIAILRENKQVANPRIVGFVLEKFEAQTLSELVGRKSSVSRQFKDGYHRDYQIDLILSFLKQFKYLHDLNILVGDIKLPNVMFNKETLDTYIVDTDSFQVNQYACHLYSVGYNDPHFIKKCAQNSNNSPLALDENNQFLFKDYYADYYRTKENDDYCLSILLFRLLMNNAEPFKLTNIIPLKELPASSFSEDDDPVLKRIKFQSILNGRFGYYKYYSENYINNQYLPSYKIWTHFPTFLKEAFINVFSNGKIISVDQWIDIFNRYKNELNVIYSTLDKDYYNDFFPNSAAKTKGDDFIGINLANAVSVALDKFNIERLKDNITTIERSLKSTGYYVNKNVLITLLSNLNGLKKIRLEIWE